MPMDPNNIPPELMQAALRSLAAENQMGGMQQEVGIYKNLGPEGLRRQTDLGSVDQRAALAAQQSQQGQQQVAQQLAQMQEFGKPRGGDYHTAGGAILGGLGDIVRQVGSAYGAHKLQGQQADLMKQGAEAQTKLIGEQNQGRFDYANARSHSVEEMINALKQRQQMNPSAPGLNLQFGELDPSLFGG